MQLLDQRAMTGTKFHLTREEIVEAWHHRARAVGFRPPGGVVAVRDLTQAAEPVLAYVSDGRWVADCPNCRGGIAAWPEHNQGCCFDCGTVATIEYPDESEITEALAALAQRPDTALNWRPDRGETAQTLRHENIVRGYLPS